MQGRRQRSVKETGSGMDWNSLLKPETKPGAAGAQPSVSLELLGGFRASLRGESIALPNRKDQALLAYLALDPTRVHAREQLATLLWEHYDDASARHSLRQALTDLRKACIDETMIVATRHAVTVQPAAFDTDVGRFLRLSTASDQASLEQAIKLYRGNLLEGSEIGSSGFEEWLSDERRRLREIAGSTLARLAQLYRGANQHRRAIDCCRRLLQVDPYNEAALRMSMELLVSAGRGLEALFTYQEFSGLLQRELDVDPEPATKELYLKIAEGRLVKGTHAGADGTSGLSLVDAFRSLDGFVMWDQADRLLLCNDKFREIFAPAADLLKPGVVWEDIMEVCIAKGRFPEALANPDEYLRRRVKRRRLGTAEAPDTLLDDGRCYRLTHRRTESGALIVIFTDATDRKQRERALERSHARLQAVLSASPLPIEEIDTDGRITFCNSAFLHLLGYEANEILGHRQAELMLGPWGEVARREAAEAAERAPVIAAQYLNKTGRMISARVHWHAVHDDSGAISGFIGFIEADRR